MKRSYSILDAPSNLGLRPPGEGLLPGVYKLAGALRNQNILQRLNADDAGVITAPRYLPHWKPGLITRNAQGIAEYSKRLSDRISSIIQSKNIPIVLGGDCSILIACALSLKQMGRYGLVFLDGHSDFRHPGNSKTLSAAAGEDLAIVSGRGDASLINLNNQRPYFQEQDIQVLGVRDNDEHIPEMQNLGINVITSDGINQDMSASVNTIISHIDNSDIKGFWIHLDLDVLDGRLLPAVDCPEPNGITYETLTFILHKLIRHSKTVGLDITIYDPDSDTEERHAKNISDALVSALG